MSKLSRDEAERLTSEYYQHSGQIIPLNRSLMSYLTASKRTIGRSIWSLKAVMLDRQTALGSAIVLVTENGNFLVFDDD